MNRSVHSGTSIKLTNRERKIVKWMQFMSRHVKKHAKPEEQYARTSFILKCIAQGILRGRHLQKRRIIERRVWYGHHPTN